MDGLVRRSDGLNQSVDRTDFVIAVADEKCAGGSGPDGVEIKWRTGIDGRPAGPVVMEDDAAITDGKDIVVGSSP